MDYWDGSWGAGNGVVAGTMMMLLCAGMIVLVLWVVRSTTGSGQPAQPGPTGSRGAEEVLDGRFARGEIDEDEYLRRRELLRAASPLRSRE